MYCKKFIHHLEIGSFVHKYAYDTGADQASKFSGAISVIFGS